MVNESESPNFTPSTCLLKVRNMIKGYCRTSRAMHLQRRFYSITWHIPLFLNQATVNVNFVKVDLFPTSGQSERNSINNWSDEPNA